MAKIIFLFLFLSCISSCKDEVKKKAISYRYQIEGISFNNKIKCIINVRIGNIYEEDQLEELSDIIKGKSDCISDHVYISYLQPGMDAAAGAWAVAEYNPDFVLRIFGKVKKNFASLKSYAVDSLNTYLGHWIDLSSQDDLVYRIKRTTNGFSLELYSPSERSNSELCPLRKTNRNGEQIFIDMGDPSQYYKINAKGNLEAFDNQGWIVTYQKIK